MFLKMTAGAACALAFLAGCATSNGLAALRRIANDPPAIDRSTPEKTVQSFWAVRDWDKAYMDALPLGCDMTGPERTFYLRQAKAQADLFGDRIDALHEVEDPCAKETNEADLFKPVVSRSIIGVRLESDARAVVEAEIKNVTPIRPDVPLSAVERIEREYGRPMRYVLTKEPQGWSIDRIFYRDPPYVFERDDGKFEIEEEPFKELFAEQNKLSAFDFIWVGLWNEY